MEIKSFPPQTFAAALSSLRTHRCLCVSAMITSVSTDTALGTTLGPCSSVLMGLENSSLLVYSLLAASLLLLLLSLSLALVVFLRGDRKEAPEPRPREAVDTQESIVQYTQEDGQLPQRSQGQHGKEK